MLLLARKKGTRYCWVVGYAGRKKIGVCQGDCCPNFSETIEKCCPCCCKNEYPGREMERCFVDRMVFSLVWFWWRLPTSSFVRQLHKSYEQCCPCCSESAAGVCLQSSHMGGITECLSWKGPGGSLRPTPGSTQDHLNLKT